jgi:uroporphyrinogen decarboxylase
MGKELIFQTLRHEKTNEIPWVPFAGVHAGKLKGYTAEEVLKDTDKLVESLLEVKKIYEPDGMPIIFDLQVEAEILGCDLLWSKDNPPSVKSHPLSDEKTIPCKCQIPTAESGRIPLILDAMKRVKSAVGDEVALYGLICGPFTLASHLRGSGIFMDMLKDAEYVTELVDYCGEIACKMAEYYIDAGMDVIAVVDPLVSQVSPAHIDKMLAPAFTAVFDFVRSKGVYSSFFVCGNATKQIDAMCRTYPDSISVDENVNLAKAKEITDKYNIAIGGNLPLTTTMLLGNQQDNMVEVIKLIDSVEDPHNFIVSPGCDMPYDTPIENTIAAGQAVKRPDIARKMVENYEVVEEDIEVEIPDYENLDKVLIEVFTLDSDTCAACTYMLKSVTDIYDEIKDIADYVEYKYTIKENIARMKKMGVSALPSIYINGEPKWESIIPSKEALIQDIKNASKK